MAGAKQPSLAVGRGSHLPADPQRPAEAGKPAQGAGGRQGGLNVVGVSQGPP